MGQIVSVQGMVKRLEGLLDTDDLSTWEQGYVKSMAKQVANKKDLSENQLTVLENLFNKHFAG